jgi:hypothetical protein
VPASRGGNSGHAQLGEASASGRADLQDVGYWRSCLALKVVGLTSSLPFVSELDPEYRANRGSIVDATYLSGIRVISSHFETDKSRLVW